MALPPRSQLLKDTSGQYRWCAWVTLVLGAALVLWPFAVFGYLVLALPWCILFAGAVKAIQALGRKTDCGINAKIKLIGGVRLWSAASVLLVLAAALFVRPAWRDAVLWYCFAAWVTVTAFFTLKPAFTAGVERQFFWRLCGGIAALGFAALMLMKPRSGLSDALRLLGSFALAWGIFQIAIPRHKD